ESRRVKSGLGTRSSRGYQRRNSAAAQSIAGVRLRARPGIRKQSVAKVVMATQEGNMVAQVETDHSLRRRDFINIAAVSFAGVGAAAVTLPLISQMNPSADVLALASTEVDISKIAPGQAIKTSWRKQPVFVRNLTPKEMAEARA